MFLSHPNSRVGQRREVGPDLSVAAFTRWEGAASVRFRFSEGISARQESSSGLTGTRKSARASFVIPRHGLPPHRGSRSPLCLTDTDMYMMKSHSLSTSQSVRCRIFHPVVASSGVQGVVQNFRVLGESLGHNVVGSCILQPGRQSGTLVHKEERNHWTIPMSAIHGFHHFSVGIVHPPDITGLQA